jgi:hypothetical protein
MDSVTKSHIDYDQFIRSCVDCVGLDKAKEILKHYFELREMDDISKQRSMQASLDFLYSPRVKKNE